MIFLDTSAIYALADSRDANHEIALEHLRGALAARETMLVHNYVIVEATALLQRRLGFSNAIQFLRDSTGFLIHWISSADHQQAISFLESRARRGLSLVDCASFVVMRLYGVEEVLGFDSDFEQEGFRTYSAPRQPL